MNNENRYYVYVHRDLNGVVFYVGSGTGHRYRAKQNRSVVWLKRSVGFTAEILCDNLTMKQAREMEELLILMHRPEQLVNIHLPTKTLYIDESILSQFNYDENSPSGLTWKETTTSGNFTRSRGETAGKLEYRNSSPFRWRVKVAGVKSAFAAHRIVWALHFPITLDGLIDHIDGNPFNNKISNLREVPHSVNARNMKKKRSNKSGVTGVHFKKNRCGSTHWSATWRDASHKSRSKSFMIGKYGNDEAFRLACEYRNSKIEELNELGYGYTRRSDI